MRIGPRLDEIERKFFAPRRDAWTAWGDALKNVHQARSSKLARNGGVLALEEGVSTTPLEDCDGVEIADIDMGGEGLTFWEGSKIVDLGGRISLAVLPPPQPWSYGVQVSLEDFAPQPNQFIVVQFAGASQPFGVGLLNSSGGDFTTRVEIPIYEGRIEIWLPLNYPKTCAGLIFQNWTEVLNKPVVVESIRVVTRVSEL